MSSLQGPDLPKGTSVNEKLELVLETFIDDRSQQDRYFSALADEARGLQDQLVQTSAEELTLEGPVRVRGGFGPGLEAEYNFTEDGLVIDIHNVAESEVVWSMSFTHSELVGLISDQFDDLEFPTV
jgi:hypothetical protein